MFVYVCLPGHPLNSLEKETINYSFLVMIAVIIVVTQCQTLFQRQALLASLTYIWRKWSKERLSNLPKLASRCLAEPRLESKKAGSLRSHTVGREDPAHAWWIKEWMNEYMETSQWLNDQRISGADLQVGKELRVVAADPNSSLRKREKILNFQHIH